MGIEIPERVRRRGGIDLPGHAGDRGAGAGRRLDGHLRRRAQHPGQQRAAPLGQRRAEGPLLPADDRPTCSAPSRSPSRTRARMPSRSRPGPCRTATTGCSPAASSGSPAAPRRGSSSSSPTSIPVEGLQGDHRVPGRAGLRRLRRRQAREEARHPGLEHGGADPRELPGAGEERPRPGGPGLQDLDRDPQRGTDRHRRPDDRRGAGRDRRRDHATSRSGSSSARPIAEFQGVQFQLAEMVTATRGGAADGLQRRPPQGRRPAVHAGGGDGQALRLRGRQPDHRDRRWSSSVATATAGSIRRRSSSAMPRSA